MYSAHENSMPSNCKIEMHLRYWLETSSFKEYSYVKNLTIGNWIIELYTKVTK